MDKRERSAIFRQRLQDAMLRAGLNKSSLSQNIGVDRSTISQLLSDSHARLPNAQVIGECAHTLGVSADWLLGLSERPERANDLLDVALSMPQAERSSVDEQLFEWHKEAAGYKIRHVPATLPDFDVLNTSRISAYPRNASRWVGESIPLSAPFTSSIMW